MIIHFVLLYLTCTDDIKCNKTEISTFRVYPLQMSNYIPLFPYTTAWLWPVIQLHNVTVATSQHTHQFWAVVRQRYRRGCGLPVGHPSYRHSISDRTTDAAASETSVLAVRLIQPHFERAPRVLSVDLNRSMRNSNRSPLSSTEFKNAWSYTSVPPVRLRGPCRYSFKFFVKEANKTVEDNVASC